MVWNMVRGVGQKDSLDGTFHFRNSELSPVADSKLPPSRCGFAMAGEMEFDLPFSELVRVESSFTRKSVGVRKSVSVSP